MTKLSIITINFNNSVGLRKTLKSVFEQSWQDFEQIIIDGGSTDGSAALIRENQDKFSYSVSEPDRGVYHAMNKGIAAAKGEYLLFLNSGDHFYSSNVLKKNHHFIATYDLVYFNMFISGENKKFVKEYPATVSFAYFLKDNLPHPSIFIKKNLFEKVGFFDDSLKIVADWKFFLDSVCRYNASYLHVDETLTTFYFDGISSLPENKGIIDLEKNQVLKSNYAAYMQDLEDVLKNMTIIHTLRRSRIIKVLVKLGFLNKF